uniref:Uncharacterized protein n=1 Tax=Pararge aegeria TaxID=116150 RepID=S4PWH9_9NEOP
MQKTKIVHIFLVLRLYHLKWYFKENRSVRSYHAKLLCNPYAIELRACMNFQSTCSRYNCAVDLHSVCSYIVCKWTLLGKKNCIQTAICILHAVLMQSGYVES